MCAEKFKIVSEILESTNNKETLIFCKFLASKAELEKRFPDIRILTYGKHAYGLNLQDYSTIIFFDKTLDYALRLQAMRRIFRTGQKKDCTYYDLTGNTGLEKMINNNINNKEYMLDYFKRVSFKTFMDELTIGRINTMKEFDLEKAKSGCKLVTRSGKKVKVLLFDRNSKLFPIVAIIDNKKVIQVTIEGKYYKDKNSDFDLMIDEKIQLK